MVKTKAHLSCILILDMFIDDESTESETSIEVNQQVNEESLGNTIQGNLPFQTTNTPFCYKAHQQLPMLYIIYANRINLLL